MEANVMTNEARGILRLSRQAGYWYLALAILGGFGIAFSDAHFLVPGDASATVAAIRGEEALFRLGICSNVLGQVCFLMAGLAFYRLFAGVNRNQAMTLAALVVASVPVAILNMVLKFGALLFADPTHFAALPQAQTEALAQWSLELQGYGTQLASVFWGLWLIPLGILVWQSSWFPKLLAVLLVVNGCAYLIDSGLTMTLPEVHRRVGFVLAALLPIGEIPFLFWLLIRGARIKAYRTRP